MNDPWDVKSVRQPGHYISCMKLNGVPLLPPVLSKECRKEMQYYKLLAKEVEKRICQLKVYVRDSDEDSAQDKTDAPDLPHDYEQASEPLREVIQDVIPSATREEKLSDSPSDRTSTNSPELCDNVSTNSNVLHIWPKLSVDLSIKENQDDKTIIKILNNSFLHTPQPTDPPERDYNNTPKKNNAVQVDKEPFTGINSFSDHKNRKTENNDLFSIEFDISKVEPLLPDPFPDMSMVDGPSSLGSKSFTGSLNNIHSESVKETSTLVRQSSYTVLNPSPLLLAHLKVQSLSTGVEVTSISMSDSLSNLGTPKKRRSWDLETAKIKWSSMAYELEQKTSANTKPSDANRNLSRVVKKPQSSSLTSSKSSKQKPRRASLPGKSSPKSEPTQKIKKNTSPNSTLTNFTNAKEQVSKTTKLKTNLPQTRKPISECEDPATKVKELYEKIQNQQLLQMAHLVEKQKREQMLLQQVFEEQNSILYRQLKTICPKSPVEAKAAWGDKLPKNADQGHRGPVSLRQLINHKTPEKSENTAASTLTDTHDNLSKCAAILKKSKDITGSIKKQRDTLTAKPQSPMSPDRSRTRTHSPAGTRQRTSRKLSYDTSASSERELEPMLTDRTNDTLAGLNVTFPSDSDDCPTLAQHSRDAARTVQVHSYRAAPPRTAWHSRLPPTPAKLAAASTIVAYAKGYLVRRLMRTERVQATVQTIKDALLCALQLHQDRAGIRGADVDLHRRLIQQITAACYSLHDTFVASSPSERCALIAADRERRRQKPPDRHYRQHTDIMSQSHSGAFPARVARCTGAHALMTQSNYSNPVESRQDEETFSGTKLSRSYLPSPRRRPWR